MGHQGKAGLIFVPPEGQTNSNGNAAMRPLDSQNRLQQVYDADGFSALASSGGGWIRAIFFRVDSNVGHAFEGVVESLQINMSTTPRRTDGMSPIFDQNTGADDIVTFGPRSASLLSGGTGSFDVSFTFSQPFFYNPTNGNLLLDFRIYEGIRVVDPTPPGNIAVLDAFDVLGDAVSSVFAHGDPNVITNGAASSIGLATLFSVATMPRLSISLESGQTVLRWTNELRSFALQQSRALGEGADWQPAGGTVVSDGTKREVSLPLDPNTAARFFRLTLPRPPSSLVIDPLSTQNH